MTPHCFPAMSPMDRDIARPGVKDPCLKTRCGPTAYPYVFFMYETQPPLASMRYLSDFNSGV